MGMMGRSCCPHSILNWLGMLQAVQSTLVEVQMKVQMKVLMLLRLRHSIQDDPRDCSRCCRLPKKIDCIQVSAFEVRSWLVGRGKKVGIRCEKVLPSGTGAADLEPRLDAILVKNMLAGKLEEVIFFGEVIFADIAVQLVLCKTNRNETNVLATGILFFFHYRQLRCCGNIPSSASVSVCFGILLMISSVAATGPCCRL